MQSTCPTGSKMMGTERRPRSSTSSQVLVSLNGCANRKQEGELSLLKTKENVTTQSTLLLLTGWGQQAPRQDGAGEDPWGVGFPLGGRLSSKQSPNLYTLGFGRKGAPKLLCL